MPSKRNIQRALPLSAWPRGDRWAWQAATRAGGLLDDAGAAAHLARVTLDDLESRYSHFLDFAARTGRLAVDEPPAATMSPELIDEYVTWLEPVLSSVTIAQSLWKIGRVAGLLAPKRDWAWLRRVQRRREAMAVPRNKRPLVVDSGRIVRAGLDLMKRAEAAELLTEFERAELYRDGLMLAMLALLPPRMRNFASLEIGRTLVRSGMTWTVVQPSSETKNRRAREDPVRPEIGQRITRFVEHYRPAYVGTDQHALLWPSRGGGPLSYDAVYKTIIRRTTAAFGHAINPHLFRDCAVTTIAIRHGDRIGIVPALLGHRDPRTFERYYNQAGMIEAVQAYQSLITALADE